MPRFESFDGTQISYDTEGSGFPILLVHGFAEETFSQWVRAGLSDKLVHSGRRVVMFDLRGHGMSGKPHEAEAYGDDAIDKDALGLIDSLGIERCDLMGYSMGAWSSLRLAAKHPQRFRAVVLGGIGRLPGGSMPTGGRNLLAEAMLAEDKSTIESPIARSFRDYADATRQDRKALAAFQSAPRNLGTDLDLGAVSVPVLVIAADGDPLAPSPQALADALPNATAATVPGTHLNVVNNKAYHEAVLAFLGKHTGE